MKSTPTERLASRSPVAITDRLMSAPEVIRTIGVSRATLYAWAKAGIISKPRKIGPRRIGWLESEIAAFVQSRQAA